MHNLFFANMYVNFCKKSNLSGDILTYAGANQKVGGI